MDDATINWKIAERMGLKEVQCDDVEEDATILVWIELRDTTGKKYRGDFASSLDAMAEAEATYTPDELSRAMWEIAKERAKEPLIGLEWWLRIPARTRAIAFLAATKNRSVSNE